MTIQEIYERLCYYDLRNSNGVKDCQDLYENGVFGNHKKEDCMCDNCFYGRTKLAEELLKYVKDE